MPFPGSRRRVLAHRRPQRRRHPQTGVMRALLQFAEEIYSSHKALPWTSASCSSLGAGLSIILTFLAVNGSSSLEAQGVLQFLALPVGHTDGDVSRGAYNGVISSCTVMCKIIWEGPSGYISGMCMLRWSTQSIWINHAINKVHFILHVGHDGKMITAGDCCCHHMKWLALNNATDRSSCWQWKCLLAFWKYKTKAEDLG